MKMVDVLLVVFPLLLLLGAVGSQEDDLAFAELPQGFMKGSVMISRLGRRFYAFRRIPYAKPPVGKLRFQAPEPSGPWEGELNATIDAPFCIQKNYLMSPPVIMGEEDCLYLNVYTPKVSPPYGLLPTMVYVHGGGWFSGGVASSILGPEFLLDRDIVLVTFNYRLGALGFLSTATEHAPGNVGLKDQVEVLRWVNKHIASFGGDPACVTLFGQSAGAASVHLHMLSPLSQGLFHRAITESGTALSAWAKPKDPRPIATKQAEAVNCTTSSPAQMVQCLQQVDVHALVDSGDIFHLWSIDPLVTYRPVIEGDGPHAFLTNDPLHLISFGHFANIPWINGVVAQEGIIRAVPVMTNQTLLDDINRRPLELFPFLMELNDSALNHGDIPNLYHNISHFYFGTDHPHINEANHMKFIDLYSDRSFLQGFYKSVHLHQRYGHDQQFLYYFNYRGKYSYSSLFGGGPRNYGVSHCDELIYLFKSQPFFPGWEENHPDLQVIDNLVTLWTRFAKFGRPAAESGHTPQEEASSCTVNCMGPDSILWDPYTPDQCADHPMRELNFLNITKADGGDKTLKFCMQRGLLTDRTQFWDHLRIRDNEPALQFPYQQAISHILYYTTLAF